MAVSSAIESREMQTRITHRCSVFPCLAALLVLMSTSVVGQRVTETLEGTFQIVVEDRFEQRMAIEHYALETSTGTVPLEFPDSSAASAVGPGSRIRVSGTRSGGRLRVASSEVLITRSRTAASNRAIGVRHVAIFLINFKNDRSQPIDDATAAQTLADLNRFFQEASYDQLSVSGDVFDLQLPIDRDCRTTEDYFGTITNSGIQAAKDAGIDLSPYQSYVFIGPTGSGQTQCQIGVATIGGNWA